MNNDFVLFYLNLVFNPCRWNLGAGIYIEAISFDGGESWYALIDGHLVPEEELAMAMAINSCLGCAAGSL